MYPWRLTDELTVQTMNRELPAVHATRERLIEPQVRRALQAGGRVVDLGAHEGWFSLRALEWGADSVLAVDVREINTRRAVLLRDHFGIPPERLRVHTASVYDIDAADIGRFDVVLALGLIYHLENPIGALRVAAGLAAPGALIVVESQLHRGGPVKTGWGMTDERTGESILITEAASWVAKFEPLDVQDTTPLAAYGGVVSLIPNRAALEQALHAVGFEGVRIAAASGDDLNQQYRRGDRGVFVGWAPTPSDRPP